MNLPGFNAEAALERTENTYRSSRNPTASGRVVQPAQFLPLEDGVGGIAACVAACAQDFRDQPRKLKDCIQGCGR